MTMREPAMRKEHQPELFASLIYLADTLVSGVDVIDVPDRLIQTCQDLLDVDAAGIMLDDQRGSLRVLASSSEEMRVLEVLQLQSNEGPCLEAFTGGEAVTELDLDAARDRWPAFAGRATAAGFRSAYALPMRLRERTIGALNLLRTSTDPLSATDFQIAQVLASMATIGLVNHRAIRRQELVAEQLQAALNSRVVIEQAKGIIAERAGVDIAESFELLRRAARSSRRPISELAAEVTEGRVPSGGFIAPRGDTAM